MGEEKTSTSVAQFAWKAATTANSSQGIEAVFDLLTAFVKERLDVTGVSFWRFNLAENATECTYLAGETLPSEEFTSSVGLDDPTIRNILAELTQRTAILPAELLRSANPSLRLVQPETKTVYMMPLYFRAQLLGVFALESPGEPAPKGGLDEIEEVLPSVALAFVAKHLFYLIRF